MEPYEGTEPYIFMSYARKDWERVKPFLDALVGAGYRIWYDAGIQAGEHWTETLVEKVEGCAAFCPLFSVAFNASRFCFEETEYAYRKDKTIVPVYLKEPGQMELRPLYRLLQSRQDLRPYQYADAAEFAERLAREQAFAPCKEPDWNKIGQIQWRLSADGVLTIAGNEDMLWPYHFGTRYRLGAVPVYQYDPVHGGSTAPWMLEREKILSIEIVDNVYAIGDNAFTACNSLIDVHISDSVKRIGNRAFRGCKSLKAVCIHPGVKSIGKRAFKDCKSLMRFCIPDSVTEIRDGTFFGCVCLTDVRIPDGLKTIGAFAFKDCDSLTDVQIPDSVTQIGYRAFQSCDKLKSVEIPAGAKVADDAFPEHTLVIRRGAAQ